MVVAQVGAWLWWGGCSQDYDLSRDRPNLGSPLPPPDLVAARWTDRLVQRARPPIDVLFVLDDSSSMEDEHATFAADLTPLVRQLADTAEDWHVGVVSSDLLDEDAAGRLVEVEGRRWIDPSTIDPTGTFGAMVASVGSDGSGAEMGLGAIYTALEVEGEAFNAGFLREDSVLLTIVVSDENDVTPTNLISLPDFVAWYSALKGLREDRSLTSIVTLEGPEAGKVYTTATAAIGGVVRALPGADWATLGDAVGIPTLGIGGELFLSRRPVVGSIDVLVHTPAGVTIPFDEAVFDDAGVLVSGAWSYVPARNSITFAQFVAEPLSVVEISYVQASDPPATP